MAEAEQESGFRADAKASGGSATGLFQFISSTWLGWCSDFGAKYGVGALAREISTDSSGKPVVADPMVRQRILGLRKDPKLSAALAGGANTAQSGQTLASALGRPPGNAELYLAHFLGAGGAASFLKAPRATGARPPPTSCPRRPRPIAAYSITPRARRARSADIYAGSPSVSTARRKASPRRRPPPRRAMRSSA